MFGLSIALLYIETFLHVHMCIWVNSLDKNTCRYTCRYRQCNCM